MSLYGIKNRLIDRHTFRWANLNTRLMLIAGKTRRTGIKGVSVMAENAWDLKDLYKEWQKRKQTELAAPEEQQQISA